MEVNLRLFNPVLRQFNPTKLVTQRFDRINRRALSSRWKPQRDADVYADLAIREGMRSRAAYKLDEINKRCDLFLRPGAFVIDLGAAPGGFSMLTAKYIRLDSAINRWDSASRVNTHRKIMNITRTLRGSQASRKYGQVALFKHKIDLLKYQLICIDRDEMKPIPGAVFIHGDLRATDTQEKLLRMLAPQEADVVLSDMAPNTTGEKETNHFRIMELADEAMKLALEVLRNGGTFVCKIFSGTEEQEFRQSLRQHFAKVRAIRPRASHRVSPEIYYIAQGFVPKHLRPDIDKIDKIDETDKLRLIECSERHRITLQ